MSLHNFFKFKQFLCFSFVKLLYSNIKNNCLNAVHNKKLKYIYIYMHKELLVNQLIGATGRI